MKIEINGREVILSGKLREDTLLYVLREQLGLVGAKLGCGIGECGACTVLVDGEPVRSCMVTAANVEGARILTIEGLAGPGGTLHPLQQAWLDENVSQCGYCQTGQIMRAAALLADNPDPSQSDIVEAMSSNLCRCGTYARIKLAVARAATALASGRAGAPTALADDTANAPAALASGRAGAPAALADDTAEVGATTARDEAGAAGPEPKASPERAAGTAVTARR